MWSIAPTRRGSHVTVRRAAEKRATTTSFDMEVLNDLDRFHLVGDAINRVPGLSARAAYTKQYEGDEPRAL